MVEVKRHYAILDAQLAQHRYVLGSIAFTTATAVVRDSSSPASEPIAPAAAYPPAHQPSARLR